MTLRNSSIKMNSALPNSTLYTLDKTWESNKHWNYMPQNFVNNIKINFFHKSKFSRILDFIFNLNNKQNFDECDFFYCDFVNKEHFWRCSLASDLLGVQNCQKEHWIIKIERLQIRNTKTDPNNFLHSFSFWYFYCGVVF